MEQKIKEAKAYAYDEILKFKSEVFPFEELYPTMWENDRMGTIMEIVDRLEMHFNRYMGVNKLSLLKENIDILCLNTRLSDSLKSEKINRIYDLISLTKRQILQIYSIGPRAVREIENCLANLDLSLKEE